MKKHSRIITLAGGLIALTGFAFPWANGYPGSYYSNASFNIITIIFYASMAIIVYSLLFYRFSNVKTGCLKILAYLVCGIGIVGFIILFFGDSLDLRIDGDSIEIEYGAFISVIGFIIAFYGMRIHRY